MKRLMVAAGVAFVLVACGDGSGPTAGELSVQLASAVPPRALVIEVVGPHQSIAVPSGLSYSTLAQGGDTMHVALVAATGTTIPNSAVIRLSVENVGRVGEYSARVIQAAGANYALLAANTVLVTVTR